MPICLVLPDQSQKSPNRTVVQARGVKTIVMCRPAKKKEVTEQHYDPTPFFFPFRGQRRLRMAVRQAVSGGVSARWGLGLLVFPSLSVGCFPHALQWMDGHYFCDKKTFFF